jgi:hypothetical protein
MRRGLESDTLNTFSWQEVYVNINYVFLMSLEQTLPSFVFYAKRNQFIIGLILKEL